MDKRIIKNKIQKEAEKVRMRVAERGELRERIQSYMEYHPLPFKEVTTKRAKDTYIESEEFSFVLFKSTYVRAILSAAMVLVIVVVPYAAERAVPGDVLYPVKVRFNEEVRSQLSFSGYNKIAWEAERVERRIAEARLLASEGKLTDEIEAAIENEVRASTESAQAELASLREDDVEDAEVAEAVFASALGVQSAVLDADAQKQMSQRTTSDEHKTTGRIAGTVKEAIDTLAASEKGSSTLSYDRFLGRVELQTTRAHELFDAINGAATDEERDDIQRRIEDIERLIGEAVETHGVGEEQDAIAMLRQALSNTQKLIVFMTDIDVRQSVALETLVPKTLTNEERIVLIEDFISASKAIQVETAQQIEKLEDEAIAEKASLGLEEIDRLLDDARVALDGNKLKKAEQLMSEVQPLLDDVRIIVSVALKEVVVEIGDPDITPVATSTPTTTDEVIEDEGDSETPAEGEVSEEDQVVTTTEVEVGAEEDETEEPVTDEQATSTEGV